MLGEQRGEQGGLTGGAGNGRLVTGEERGKPCQGSRIIDCGSEIKNVSKIHVAIVLAKEREGIALGDRGAWVASQRVEATLHAVQQHQVVIGAQRAEFRCDFVQAFAELIEGMGLARKLWIGGTRDNYGIAAKTDCRVAV